MHRILIVDDEEDVLRSTALVVESLGYQAIQVQDASAILEVIAKDKPDLVLQDLRMPGLNVAGLVASLRSDPATATLPLVFFSANTDIAATAARYDAWGYLAKPFTADQLASVLEKALGNAAVATLTPRRDPEREVRDVFHDYWNLLAAVANYSALLNRLQGLPLEARAAVKGLEDSILKLEAKTDRLRSYAKGWSEMAASAPRKTSG